MLFCENPNCNESAIICCQAECECWNNKHNNCHFAKSKVLVNTIIKKIKNVSPKAEELFDTVIKIYDEIIETLSFDREAVLTQKDLYGLRNNEAKLITLLNEGTYHEIKGKLIQAAYEETKIEHEFEISLNVEKAKEIWDKMKINFETFRKELRTFYSLEYKKI